MRTEVVSAKIAAPNFSAIYYISRKRKRRGIFLYAYYLLFRKKKKKEGFQKFGRKYGNIVFSSNYATNQCTRTFFS